MSVQTEIDRIITAVGAAYDAVEAKGGTLPASETVANLAEAISSIPKETHQAVEQATPSLTLNAATGVVTAEATQAAGLVAAGTKKATMQLATQAAKTVTPTEAEQTAVASGKYTTGDVVIAAVPTEEKTVELSMPSGDQTVIPSAGKFLSAVTVKKPATMLPENIKKGVSIGGVVGTLESGGGSSGGDIDALIARTIREITSDADKVGAYAFHGCMALTTANFPQATSIVEHAFGGCTSLTTASFPQATSIGGYAFADCRSLKTAEFLQATSLGSTAFRFCSGLTIANFPQVIGLIGNYAFSKCTSLTTVSFPQATSIGQRAFEECSGLTTAEFPQAGRIEQYAFYKCTSLTTAGFPKATYIGINAFVSCSNLTALVLGNTEQVCTLASPSFLTGTPIAAGTGYIYVPDALVDSYKNTSAWNANAAQIKPLSEYSA